MMASLEEMKQWVSYNPETGFFTRVRTKNNRCKVGEVCGFVDVDGYRRVRVLGKSYLAQRLAFFFMTGSMPEGPMDHINGDRDDNRWKNLRLADASANAWNQKRRSGASNPYKGVTETKSGKFEAAIAAHGRRYFIGTFATAREAYEEYIFKALELHGEFVRVE